MMQVRFLRHYSPYNGGEIAGFDDPQAQALIAAGAAVEVKAYATLAELEAEVLKAGYKAAAAKKIARERFEGKHGEPARFLAPVDEAGQRLGE